MNHFNSKWDIATGILLILLFSLIILTFRHYGLTWDEKASMEEGEHFVGWYTSLFTDRTLISKEDYFYYGSFFTGLAFFLHRFSPLGLFETSHLLNALFGLVGVIYTYKTCRLIAGPKAAFFSIVFLALTPIFWGHSFNNPKDIPIAALFMASFYYIVLSYQKLPNLSTSLLIKLALCIGFALGTRVINFSLLLYLGGAWSLWMYNQKTKSHLKTLLKKFLVVTFIAYSIMLAFWPYAQVSPLWHPLESLLKFSHFNWPFNNHFKGRFISASSLPWDYVLTWFLITLPEYYLVCLFLGGFLFFQRMKSSQNKILNGNLYFILFLAIFLPILLAIVSHAVLYDGIRHFIFTVPLLAVLAGVSYSKFLEGSAQSLFKWMTSMAIALSAATCVWDMIKLHPYEAIYYNRMFSGGFSHAVENFEGDYWGMTYKEAAQWLIQNYQSEKHPVKVANCSASFLSGYFLEKINQIQPRFISVEMNDDPDIVLATTRWDFHKRIQGKVIHIVERMNTPLAYVFEMSKNH